MSRDDSSTVLLVFGCLLVLASALVSLWLARNFPWNAAIVGICVGSALMLVVAAGLGAMLGVDRRSADIHSWVFAAAATTCVLFPLVSVRALKLNLIAPRDVFLCSERGSPGDGPIDVAGATAYMCTKFSGFGPDNWEGAVVVRAGSARTASDVERTLTESKCFEVAQNRFWCVPT